MTRHGRGLLLATAAASVLLTGAAQATPRLAPHLLLADEPRTPAPRPDWPAEILALTDDEREPEGCDPLIVDDRLTAAAHRHAHDMADHQQLTHVGSDGSRFYERIEDEGHPEPGAENVARGYPDAATTVREWMASPAHRTTILDCDYVTIGVGFDPRGNFVAQEFGLPEE